MKRSLKNKFNSSEYSHWIPSSSPNLPFRTTLILKNEFSLSPNSSRFEFELKGKRGVCESIVFKYSNQIQFKGPDHMALSISPRIGNTLTSWSFLNTPPVERYWGNRKLYFMMLIYGIDNSPINFDLVIEVGEMNCVSVKHH